MERRTCTREVKLEAVKLIQARGVTVAHAARDLGVQGSVLRRWGRSVPPIPSRPFPARGR